MEQTDETGPKAPHCGDFSAGVAGTTVPAVCWECGAERECIEYLVCCTGTMYHICPECLAKNNDEVSP